MKSTAVELHRLVQVGDPDECWHWLGYHNPAGYGRMKWGDGWVLTHRHTYQQMVGPIPDGLVLDHLCRNRWCCNPAHVEPVTVAENNRRGEWWGKTHCVNGHEYTDENTIWRSPTNRNCRECSRTANRRCAAKRRAAMTYPQ